MHSIEELKRAYEAAASRAQQARCDEITAARRYTERAIADKLAELEAMGITPGSKVTLIWRRWDNDKETRKVAGFLGVEAGYSPGDTKIILSKLKNDGTPSKSKAHFSFHTIEPFEAAPAKSPDEEPRSGDTAGAEERQDA